MVKKSKGNCIQVIFECIEYKKLGLLGIFCYVMEKNCKNILDCLEFKKFNFIMKCVILYCEIK